MTFGTQSVFVCNVKLIQLKGGDTLTIKLFFANQFKDISIEVLYTPCQNVWSGSKSVITFCLINILTHPC